MKKLFTLAALFCLALSSQAQDCSKYLTTTTDKVTGTTSTRSNYLEMVEEKTGAKAYMYSHLYNKQTLMLSYKLENTNGCMDIGNKINILFKDGTRAELVNLEKFNCDGSGYVYFAKLSPLMKTLRQMEEKEIEIIRFYTNKSYFEATLSPEQAEMFKGGLNCLMPLKK